MRSGSGEPFGKGDRKRERTDGEDKRKSLFAGGVKVKMMSNRVRVARKVRVCLGCSIDPERHLRRSPPDKRFRTERALGSVHTSLGV